MHVKVYKGSRIYHESVHIEGIVKIKCRNCRRWYRVSIVGYVAELANTQPPETLARDGSDPVLDG